MKNSSCCALGTKKQESELKFFMREAKKYKHTTIKVLQGVQKIYGYLPKSVLKFVSQEIGVGVGELFSVASFYAEFSFSPRGKFPISVCLGTACYVKGAEEIFNKICMLLNIKEGETTLDGKFSIDQTRCIGCCGMAPVMVIGDEVVGNVKLADVEKILKSYMEK